MAELKIEKKSPIWPWILVILAVIAAIAYFMYNDDVDENSSYNNDVEQEMILDTTNNHTSQDYQTTMNPVDSISAVDQFNHSISDETRIGTDSTYTKTAMRNLAIVVSKKAEDIDLQTSKALENINKYSQYVDEITNSEIDAYEEVYNDFKLISNDIVTVLESIQTKSYPSLQNGIKGLKDTANKINSNMSLDEQDDTFQNFFRKAKNVVNNMST